MTNILLVVIISEEGLIMSQNKQKKKDRIAELLNESDEILDTATTEEGEELHRQLSHVSAEDLFEPFTI